MSTNPPTILLDLDDVLADFVGGAFRIHGFAPQQINVLRKPGVWSINEPMGLTLDRFWEPINESGEAFWLNLKPLSWMQELTNLVQSITHQWYIVSSPSDCLSAYAGKIRWLKHHLGPAFNQYIITKHKTLLARPGTILIDDREETVKQFINAGGVGIVFPSRGNSWHTMAHDPMPTVTIQLNCLTRPYYQGNFHGTFVS